MNPSILWEGSKAVIRGKIIQISLKLKRHRLEEHLRLENKIKFLESQHKTTRVCNTATELKEARKNVENFYHIRRRELLDSPDRDIIRWEIELAAS